MKTLFYCASLFLFLAEAREKVLESEGQGYRTEIVAAREDVIWGFDFLSPTEIIFTERGGKIAHLDLNTKKVTEISGVPPVHSEGQGGMLDVSVVPNSKGKKILFSYSYAKDKKATTAVGLATLENFKLKDFKRIFEANAWSGNEIHFGSRIVWESPEVFFLTVGDRNERDLAQSLNAHNGKVLRLTLEGKAAKGNPLEGKKGVLPEIWSYGHRNPQGLAMDSKKNLFEAEFGPRGGDEINLVKKSVNYGWPVITYGREYWGPKIGTTSKSGMEQPLVHWVPSISPSGISFYNGTAFPKWKGNLFIANLSGSHVRRLVFDSNFKVVKQESLLEHLEFRFRDIQEGPDGYIYFSTDHGVISRITPLKTKTL